MIGLLSVAFVITGVIISRRYGQALIALLEQEDFSFLLSQEASDLIVADPATLRSLEQKLEESKSPEFTIFMAKLISDIGGNAAVPILDKAARQLAINRDDELVKATMLTDGGKVVHPNFASVAVEPDRHVEPVEPSKPKVVTKKGAGKAPEGGPARHVEPDAAPAKPNRAAPKKSPKSGGAA